MKFLIVGSIHHPQELIEVEKSAPPDEPPLFPPSQAPYFWTRALRKLGHTVEAFIRNVPAVFGWQAQQLQRYTGVRRLNTALTAAAYRFPQLQPDYRIRNRRLLAKVRQFEPGAILLIGDNREIYPETLRQIKTLGCKIVYMSGVSPIVFSSAIERKAAPLYDLVLVNDFYHGIQWIELGAQRMEALPLSACDPDFHHSFDLSAAEQRDYGCDVGFVGTLLPPALYGKRIAALESLADFQPGIWSVHALPPSLEKFYRGSVLGEKMLRVLCGSKIQVNPHGNFMRYGGNMRLFESAACRVFQIADDLPGNVIWFTSGETIAIYRDLDHLHQQTAYYLAHPDERQQIAAAAQAHVYAHHTYLHRMKALVELVSTL